MSETDGFYYIQAIINLSFSAYIVINNGIFVFASPSHFPKKLATNLNFASLCTKFRNIKLLRLAGNSSIPSYSSSFIQLPRRTCRHALSSSWLGFSTGTLLLAFLLLYMMRSCGNSSSILIKNLSASTSSLTDMAQMEAKNRVVEQIGLLNAVEDLYGGVTVDMKEPVGPKVFAPLLRASISKWRQQGKKGVWIKLPIELASLVEPVVQEGFRYHHAESDYLMLVLVVKEKSGGFKGTGVWKLPTGVVNEGEDICTAAIREVKEETGIETEFVEVLAFRQSHQSFFGKSDLFFICMLQPHSLDIQKQDSEIEAAQWMSIEEYVNQPYNKEHQLFKYVAEICKTKSEGEYVGFSSTSIATASGKDTYLYFNNRDFNNL